MKYKQPFKFIPWLPILVEYGSWALRKDGTSGRILGPHFLRVNGRNLVSRDSKAKVKVGITFVANVLLELTLTYHFALQIWKVGHLHLSRVVMCE